MEMGDFEQIIKIKYIFHLIIAKFQKEQNIIF